ncbi:SDR family oxidoreductase [Mycobacterium sp. CVI_P3]|uniref:SDR family oxidoreductase n=1 Tax=Mycobacterium pinniadriaticum TaxID=2994102 RepID=A0ABT3SMS4_9MYCO|nr:SDR family oxidoreductase [Mycobacterium pinniadriaticum]MCX2933695.1 SDR family oxidoreductase [Mycobacterium pinniadriaticum]MCX2940117.1 SDR family oxidoreductase [Mycobacterium pinniadriaticum]
MGAFTGKCVIVTGAAGGIGTALSERFAVAGASLVLADTNDEGLAKLAAKLEGDHAAPVVTSAGDLSTREAAEEMVRQAVSVFGRLDVLVNNAGGGVIRPTLSHTEETLQATIDRNLWSALRSTLAALPVMLEAGNGRVIFMGADSVRNGLEDHAIYNAAKGGVHAVAGSFSREFGKQGITFNVVAPPAVRSPEFERFLREQPELTQRFVSQIPMGRPAEMSEVAALVEFLAGEEAGFINGQVVGVNGGSTLA